MNREVIFYKQGMSLIVLFIIGSSSVFVMGLEAKKDIWIASILAILMALPLVLIYARLHYIFPDKDLFDIIEFCFGKILGKTVIAILTIFIFYWAADVMVNYGNFISVVTLVDTPQIIPMMALAFLCAWGIKEGIEVLGKWSELFLSINVIIIFVTVVLLIPKMDINNIRPVFYGGMKPILQGAFNSFSFPFAQIMAFSLIFSGLRGEKASYKIYILGLIIGGIILIILSLTNVLVIGVEHATRSYYPSYSTVARMNVGSILQRLEVIIALVFIFGGFIKISVLFLGTCKGVSKLFGHKDYRFIVIPITLLGINLSFFQYESILHYTEFQSETWLYFTSPFQVILPIVIWIITEIKVKRLNRNKINNNINNSIDEQ